MKTRIGTFRKATITLDAMSGRLAPSDATEKKIGKLFRLYLNKTIEDIDGELAAIRKNNPVEDLTARDLPVAVREAREAAVQELNRRVIEIKDIPPNLLLTDADMPRSYKGCPENAVGVADMRRHLAFLMPIEGEELENFDAAEAEPIVAETEIPARDERPQDERA